MKIETKHWMAASQMMIAAGKSASPESISLDVSALVEGEGKEKEEEKKPPETPKTPPKTKAEDEYPEIKPKEEESNEAVESLRIDPFKDNLTNTTLS